MAKTKVLIAVKTYPSLSNKYGELVCTAGFLEDGSWIRIYPVPFRKLDYQNRYHKWQWIELDLVKNSSDFRPESYRPYSIDSEIRILEKMGTEKNWEKRKSIALKKIWTNMTDLISEAKSKKGTSLAVLRPSKIINFICEPCEREWDAKKVAKTIADNTLGNLFDEKETKNLFDVVKKLPYKFSYVFTTEDGLTRTLMIEDWELGALYWNMFEKYKDETVACKKVYEKYFTEFSSKKELYFFLGTSKKFHNIAPNPFIIIGAFYPPKSNKSNLPSLFPE